MNEKLFYDRFKLQDIEKNFFRTRKLISWIHNYSVHFAIHYQQTLFTVIVSLEEMISTL